MRLVKAEFLDIDGTLMDTNYLECPDRFLAALDDFLGQRGRR